MAEAEERVGGRETLPQRGKVAKVCQEFMIHEDGALAHQEQSQEFQRHYGLNRFNRRTVREDIPVAKVVQSDEEQRQQEERYQELQALNAQAEEDAEIARRYEAEILGEEEASRRQREYEDEMLAKKAQEKEKEKYDKYMERKRIKQLKKERETLEQQLQQNRHEAGLAVNQEPDPGAVSEGMRDVNLGNSGRSNGFTARVTPAGQIEDDGDFSDFYPQISNHMDTQQKKFIQEMADEELAIFLQEQEHKRTKAKVNPDKLKEIQEQDARLAKIIQEQEELRHKKRSKNKKQHEEVRRQQSVTNPATRPLPDLPGRRASDPPVQRSHDLHRLRRDSFLQSLNSDPPEQPHHRSPESETSAVTHSSGQSRSSRQNSHNASQARQKIQPSHDMHPSAARNVERWLENSVMGSQTQGNNPDQRGRLQSNQSDDHIPSPSPPGSYHSEDEIPYTRGPPPPRNIPASPEENHYAVSNPIPYNIAAAIDPTYRRRQHEIRQTEETEAKMPATMLSSSLPMAGESELEWDPSLRGSLRRPKGTWNPMAAPYLYHGGGTGISSNESYTDDGPVISPWQPVQGQRRSGADKQRKSSRNKSPSGGNTKPSNKSSCKQQ